MRMEFWPRYISVDGKMNGNGELWPILFGLKNND